MKPYIELSESTLYTILKRLETADMLTVQTAEHDGRLRKYYRITDNGLKRIEEFKSDWNEIMSIYRFVTKKSGIQIVGDDLFTTNPKRVAYGISKGAANTVLLKVNQIGTISEALEMIQYAYKFGYGVMPCDSRGEGAAIADYAVGINASTIRECALGNSGNRFLEIEEELGSKARFIGARGLKGFKNQQRADELSQLIKQER